MILAAGAGRRLGLGPKAHVVLEGETLLSRAVRCCRAAGVEWTHVLGRPDDPALATACQALGVPCSRNPRPEAGMFSSVRVALAALLPERPRGVLLFAVDHPRVQAETVRRIAAALDAGGPASWVRPVHRGRHGHPIAIGAALLSPLLGLAETTPLRDALVAVKGSPLDVACDDPGVTDNVNVPEDLK